MSGRYRRFCPPPPNYKALLEAKYVDRLKRLHKLVKIVNRPLLIVLHLFADDVVALKHWIDMIYELAAPEAHGAAMDFFIDDVYGAYVFNEYEFNFYRSEDLGYSMDSPPLIYGVTAEGRVVFFGNLEGPHVPTAESLKEFCEQLTMGTIEPQPLCPVKVLHVDLASMNELIYSESLDIALCLYSSLQNGTDVNKNCMQGLETLSDKLKQEPICLYKMDTHGVILPKKFQVESTPAMFFLQGSRKHCPILCKYNLDLQGMLKFVAGNASTELHHYNCLGHHRLYAELQMHMEDYFGKN
ncbi:uncharacterized protein DMAD_09865 [Drosophila madeirensis]|uniref:Uncharacterized protein n=1 Tax=Drosophila madeirensis TaxID=30013 RepID=A0AAU9F843_DROMD